MAVGLPGLAAAIAAFIFLVLAAVALRRGGGLRARLLALLLAALAGPLLNLLALNSGLVLTEPRLAFIGNTLGLAAAPLLYLFACALSVRDFRLNAAHGWHFAPLAAIAGLVLFAYHLQAREAQLAVLTDPGAESLLNQPLIVLGIFAYPLVYLAAAFRVAWRHERLAREVQAKTDGRELRWLGASLAGLAVGAALSVLQYAASDLLGWAAVSQALIVLLALGALGLATYFLVHALPGLTAIEGLPPAAASPDKYGEDRIDDAALARFADALDRLIEQEAPYRDPELSLAGLAGRLPMTARELSQTINRTQGCSFYEFIARLRAEAAVAMLAEAGERSVTEVMLAAGFSSKSSFYAAFKAATGLTPGEWRRRNGFENAQADDA